ncbi:hypothetical protein FRC05_007852 [Tulasnella sp. 425]|nr:hypothetical protein FRC05_007852 [Tulasnella sp. 425]
MRDANVLTDSVSATHLVRSSLQEEYLRSLNHLFIDIARIKYEPGYEGRRGGYCDLHVASLDPETPTAPRKLVAVKKLLLGTRTSEPIRLAFRLARELKVWAGLRHPHILPLTGFYLGNDYKTALLISEYMVYGDLKDYIAKMKPSREERLLLVRDLTHGLVYLHTQNPPVRHGDLKPGNVLVNSQCRALLADFGLSKALDAGPTGFTTGNDARCTVRYSSPELLLQGTAGQSLRDDIWSWGCLVLEALTDKMPFADIETEPQLIFAIVQGRSPCDVNHLSLHAPQLRDLLLKCWSSQPNQRPAAVGCLHVVDPSLPKLDVDADSSTTLGMSGLGLTNDGWPNEARNNNNTGTSQAGAGHRPYQRTNFALETNPFSQSDSSLPLPTANSNYCTTVQAARSCINLSGLGLANDGGLPDPRNKGDTGTGQDGAASAAWAVPGPRLYHPLPPYKRTSFSGETNLFEFSFYQSGLSRARPMVNFKNSTVGPSVNENSNATTGKEVSNRFRNPADAGASAREQKASLKATLPPRFIEQPTSEGGETTAPAQAARPDNKRARPSSNSSTASATSSALPTRRRRVMSARNDPGEQDWNQPMGGT